MKDNFQDRKYVIQGVIILVAVVLLGRCLQLQLNAVYQENARESVMFKETVYPSRGAIVDRKGNLMVVNQAVYDLMVTVNQVKNLDTAKFCRLLKIDKKTFERKIKKDFRDPRYAPWVPFPFLKRISTTTYNQIQESMYQFKGFEFQLRNIRGYPHRAGGHVLGYISEVNKKQIKKDKYYQQRDYIGSTGMELAYEKELRGTKGVRYILRDNFGRLQGSYKNGILDVPAESGKILISSIDLMLQKYGEELMQNKKGSVVAIEPATGEVLALISSPGYDPNELAVTRYRNIAFQRLQKDSNQVLFNRALQAQYPPGSIFKPLMSLIALQEDVLEPDRTIGCRGGYIYKGLRVGCHGHAACTSVQAAIQHSCNAYYCQVFRDIIDKNGFTKANLGLDTLVQYWHRFGLGGKLGIDIPNELTGNLPTTAYYDKLYGKGAWKSPTIISLGIGQGELLLTPLQMANFCATIANRGYFVPPHLAKAFKGDTIPSIPKHFRTKYSVAIDPEHFDVVVDGMEKVVQAGTARIAQIKDDKDIAVCGKTGTAENPHGADHSVFIAFAPKDNPKIAIAVFVENSGYGSRYGAPVASLMIEKYLTGNIGKSRKYLEKRMFEANLLK